MATFHRSFCCSVLFDREEYEAPAAFIFKRVLQRTTAAFYLLSFQDAMIGLLVRW
jgi:hypothetical protein